MPIPRNKDEKMSDYIARNIEENMKTMPIEEAIKKSFDEIETDQKDVYRVITETIDNSTKVKVKVDADLTWSRMLRNKKNG